MGIRSEVQLELAAALDNPDELGDISRAFEYEHPTTGVMTTGRGWRALQKIVETNGESSQVYDLVFKCLTNELAVEPEIDGQLHVDGANYFIKDVKSSPSDTTWTMFANG